MTNVADSQAALSDPGPSGLGGWLVLPILGFIGTIMLTGWNMLQAVAGLDGLVAIFTATSGPLVSLKIPMAASIVFGLLVMASAIYCLYLIFSKRYAIIKFATAHYIVLAIAGFADLWRGWALEKAIPNTPPDPTLIRDTIRGVLIACIWIPYFHLSKRVKNTFSDSAALAVPAEGGVTTGTVR